jgi:16S rRNA (cytosine967-C5)-methyltransferase
MRTDGGGAAHQVNPGRVAAAAVLLEVEAGAHAEDELAQRAPADPRDRGLAWNLVMGALRRKSTVDAAVQAFLDRPVGAVDPAVRAVLRAGAYEILLTRAPRHAVVHDAVEVARALGVGRASGLVNAVLRRVELPTLTARADRLDHPAWLVDRWTSRYGHEATDAWCLANNEQPPLVVGATDPAATLALWAEAGLGWRPARAHGAEVPRSFELVGSAGRLEGVPGWDGLWVQDAASAWMTDLIPASATTVLDACAAPGGKTMRLAARGAQVMAVDSSETRLERLSQSCKRLGLPVRQRRHDWTTGPIAGLGELDAVLVDAPCTGLGTVRRHPEIRWRRGPLDPGALGLKQAAILRAAATHCRRGGHVAYVVCSSEPEEGPEVVRAVAARAGLTLVEERLSAPPSDGEDAFYGALLERR